MSSYDQQPPPALNRPVTPEGTKPPSESDETSKGKKRAYEEHATEQKRSEHSTPMRPRSVHSSGFRDGTLDEKRFLLLEELGHAIPEIPLTAFFSSFCPPLKDGINVDAIKAVLADRGILANGRWSSFPKDPKSFRDENATFSPLEQIFNSVIACVPNQKASFLLRLLPSQVPESDRGSTSKPDAGCMKASVVTADGALEIYSWYDMAFTGEFKLRNTEGSLDDDVTKIIYSMQQTMSLDLCRRFTFGITIENTTMRLWFCSRSVMVVSEGFDFITQPDHLIRTFLSFAFATGEELGWDPTIRVHDRDKRIYDIEVNDKWYRVIDVLSDFGADAIIGRAARVFKVRDLDTNEERVLKDVWVEDDRKLEHELYAAILNDVKEKFGDMTARIVSDHLLTPLNHCEVPIDGRKDSTDSIMRNYKPSFRKCFILKAELKNNEDKTKSVAPMRSSDRDREVDLNTHFGSRLVRPEPRVRNRRHYRIVFKEIAVPIWTVRSLSKVFRVLKDCIKVLTFIHGCGWVHRDISAGNVYLFDERGIIGDLEYARKVYTDGSHDMLTGTPDFMAVEVLAGDYLFRPRDSEPDLRSDAWEHDASMVSEEANTSGSVFAPKFAQNEAHDIESLWWISIYVLFFNYDEGALDNQTPDQARTFKKMRALWTSRIFGNAENMRRMFFEIKTHYVEGMKWLSQSLNFAIGYLDNLRRALVSAYTRYEKDIPTVHPEAFTSLYQHADRAFTSLIVGSEGITISPYKTSGMRLKQAVTQQVASVPGGPGKRRILKHMPGQRIERIFLLQRPGRAP